MKKETMKCVGCGELIPKSDRVVKCKGCYRRQQARMGCFPKVKEGYRRGQGGKLIKL